MSFMTRQIEFGDWWEIDGDLGTDYVPSFFHSVRGVAAGHQYTADEDEFAALAEGLEDHTVSTRIFGIELVSGWGARLSASGYMDCTEWAVFPTQAEAEAWLDELQGDDDAL